MRVLAEREPWMDDGLCHGIVETLGPAERDRLFFPTRGGDMRRGKAICGDCPVRQECAEHAIEHRELYGIWGGLSERERRRIRTQRKQEAGADLKPIKHGTKEAYATCRRRNGGKACALCKDAHSRFHNPEMKRPGEGRESWPHPKRRADEGAA